MWRSDRSVHRSNKELRLERHITELATLRIKCALAHLVRENRMHGLMREGRREPALYSTRAFLPSDPDREGGGRGAMMLDLTPCLPCDPLPALCLGPLAF